MKVYYNDKGLQLGNLLYLCLQVFKDRKSGNQSHILQGGWYRQAQIMFPNLTSYFGKANGQSITRISESYYQIHGIDYTSQDLDEFCKEILLPGIEEKISHIKKKDIVICIRRTDMYEPHQINNYGFDNVSYVNKALEKYDKNNSVRVVSDDIDWCKENLNISDYKEVEICQTDRVENFWQMLRVNKGLIAPNSTFAYWAGYVLRLLDGKVKVTVPDFNTYLIEEGKQIADTRGWDKISVETNLEKQKVGVFYVVTGNYKMFFEEFYNTARKYLFNKNKVTYYVYTDDLDYFEKYNKNNDIKLTLIEHKPFPYPTLYRYHFFKRNISDWGEQDLLLFFNANTVFRKNISAELLPRVEQQVKLLTLPVYNGKTYIELPFEKRKESVAYIPFDLSINYRYVQGGFIGAYTNLFKELVTFMIDLTEKDKTNNIIPTWHDESYLNKFAYTYPNNIDYLKQNIYLPEEYGVDSKIVLLDKKKLGGHDKLRFVPEVSIIIPVKGGATLLKSIESVSNQLYTDWECIIVDDGINKEILEDLKLVTDKDKRFKVVKSKGRGISEALNTGIKEAAGTYIARLDDDDQWYDFHLSSLLEVLESNPNLDIVGSKADTSWQSGIYTSIKAENPYYQLVHKNPFNHPGVIYKKSAVEKLDAIYKSECDGFEDYELWSRLLTPTNGLVLNMASLVYNYGLVNKDKWWFNYLIFRHKLCKRFSKEFNTKFYIEQVIYND